MSSALADDAPAALQVDWEAAGRWAARLASPGPTPSRAVLEHLVADLHHSADRAHELALRAARLEAVVDAAWSGHPPSPQVLVVDRSGWARGAAQSFGALVGPLLSRAPHGVPDADDLPDGGPGRATGTPADDVRGGRGGLLPAAVRAAPATAQAAGLLGLLASRVLGQFDPYAAPTAGGRLLLVAPNVLHVERALGAVPADFRLWVSVHEQTHALQFAAAPWLSTHLRGEVAGLVADLARSSAGQELVNAVGAGLRNLRSGRTEEDWTPLDLVLDEEQRGRVDRISAVMALLEGHADVSMDAVGARAIPSVRRLRARMDARRRDVSGVDRWLRKLIGMDAKLAQYRDGAAFVRTVRRVGGRDSLDAVWSGPDALPTPREIADPHAWVRRVHG